MNTIRVNNLAKLGGSLALAFGLLGANAGWAANCEGLPSSATLVPSTSAVRTTLPAALGTANWVDEDTTASGVQVDVCVVNNYQNAGRVAFLTKSRTNGQFWNIGRTNGAGDNGVADYVFGLNGNVYATGDGPSGRRIWTPKYDTGSVRLVYMSSLVDTPDCGEITVPDSFQSLVDENASVAGTQVAADFEKDAGTGRLIIRSLIGDKIIGRTNGSDNPSSIYGCYNLNRVALVFALNIGKVKAYTPQFNSGSVKLLFNSALIPNVGSITP